MKALITGATGFVGGALARRLHGLGWQVVGLGRNWEAGKQLAAAGITFLPGELRDAATIAAACRGREIVFHCAGCREANVGRLVHVSTPSIYFDLRGPMAVRLNVAEDAPLPLRAANAYVQTKRLAEQLVDQAHHEGLPVITLRPRAIFGPGDTAILPRLLTRLRTGRLAVIGDGRNLTDLTYIDNVVDALLCCAESPTKTLGKKYNLSNDEPVLLWEMVRRLCTTLNYPFPQRRFSFAAAYLLAWGMEMIWARLPGYPEPPPRFRRGGVCPFSQHAALRRLPDIESLEKKK
ncbi:MAG: NAD-dependent epimerase/dehydratase family protein [Caldilinea sp.]|nr:NAD-dependent epimerase/dehydratase family protein [Caldilinea sp.]